jgi:sensor domain CHASE-containing protein
MAYPAPPAPAPRRRSTLGTLVRTVGTVLLIAAIAAIVVAVVLLITDTGGQTDVGNILRDNLDQQIDSLRSVIEENTGR